MADRYIFGANGVVESEMDDFQLHREYRSLDWEIATTTLLGLVLALSASVYLKSIYSEELAIAVQLTFLLVSFISVGVSFHSFAKRAVEQRQLPGRSTRHYLEKFEQNEEELDPNFLPHRHITGFGAAVFLLFCTFVAFAAIFGHINHGHFRIPGWFGLVIVACVCAGLLGLISAPRLTDFSVFNSLYSAARSSTAFLDPLGRRLSQIDSWLVFVVAPTVGATQNTWQKRYTILFGNLLAASLFAWFAPPLIALACVSWAVLSAIATARRWSWIEADRDELLRSTETEAPSLRIGTQQDLRDEALLALLFLVLILPLGMRQIHILSDFTAFIASKSETNNYFAWTGFFGVELVKALPFIDWSDIYGATGSTSIESGTAVAEHAVFASRVIIDLVFLASILQAISISVSLAKHKKRFLTPGSGVNKLDPRIEKAELAKLVKEQNTNGIWDFRKEISQYEHYDTKRLSYLRLKTRNSTSKREQRVYAVVKEIFSRTNLAFSSPNELLRQEAEKSKPRISVLMDLLDNVERLDVVDLDELVIVRRSLNWKGGIEAARKRVVRLMVHATAISPDRAKALAAILAGETVDSLSSIRLIVLKEIKNAATAKSLEKELRQVALHDPADSLKSKALQILKKHNLAIVDQGQYDYAA